jgi:hypothetical protein
MDYLENKRLNYIISARFHEPVQRLLAKHQPWLPVDDGIEISETAYQAPDWEASRRLIVVRQCVKECPKAGGKQLRLFKNDCYYKHFRYTAYFTDMKLPAAEVWQIYRQRADAENQIKELKYDFGFDSFNMDNFYAIVAALTFVIIAYNLMAIFPSVCSAKPRAATSVYPQVQDFCHRCIL